MSKAYDIIIAGAGPVGLFLACELKLVHASVLVLERELNPESPWKAEGLGRRGLNTAAVEFFYWRGLLSQFFGPGEEPSSFQKIPGFQFGGHFAGISTRPFSLFPFLNVAVLGLSMRVLSSQLLLSTVKMVLTRYSAQRQQAGIGPLEVPYPRAGPGAPHPYDHQAHRNDTDRAC